MRDHLHKIYIKSTLQNKGTKQLKGKNSSLSAPRSVVFNGFVTSKTIELIDFPCARFERCTRRRRFYSCFLLGCRVKRHLDFRIMNRNKIQFLLFIHRVSNDENR